MAKDGLRLLSPWCTSFCLSLLCLYLLIPKVSDRPLSDLSSLLIPKSQIWGRKIQPDSVTSLKRKAPSPTAPYQIAKTTNHTSPDGSSMDMEYFAPTNDEHSMSQSTSRNASQEDTCVGRYIYVQELPRKFNEGMVEDCFHLTHARNMCTYLENYGFGQKMSNEDGVFSDSGWYVTDQFALDVIFYNEMKKYDCLTSNSSVAAAVYVPYYAGFDSSRYYEDDISAEVRDATSIELVTYLRNTPQWSIMGGKDHFLVSGRITWEFRRTDSRYKGNQLLLLPEVKNMTTLLIESSPWDTIDFAIPYPTSFHPSTDEEVLIWQDRMRKVKKEWLYSFVGAPRSYPTSIRGQILEQCKRSTECKLLHCGWEDIRCRSPGVFMSIFQGSVFCLQPSGDSPTRKSTFDSILAGCIPVFFHPASAYVEYIWHLPKDYTKYSVYIAEDDIRNKNVSIEDTLKQISSQRIQEMREEVINLISKIVYANPDSKGRKFKDAFDVTLEAVIQRVRKLRRKKISDDDDKQPEEEKSHEWDSFFKP